ncbi:MAG: NUDIX domain-containing protein [Firmicutes bacterium]|nr:NUDIX domain-containing protein [Bacillota bacterium]
MNKDCGFIRDNYWFRYRACAIIIEDGNVLMTKNEKVPYYYSVGGGVHLNETAQDAVIREVYEETGEYFEVERLAFIHENFFKGTWDDENKICHEIAFYFLMKPKGIKEFNWESRSLDGVKETVSFLPIDKLHEYEVYPTFFKDKLKNMKDGIEHILRKDD